MHGKSDRLNVLARVKQDGDRLLLQDIDARVDAKTLSTGMGIRDQHMGEKIFTAEDGSVPELRFEAPAHRVPHLSPVKTPPATLLARSSSEERASLYKWH